jgi:hypothetical protein
MEARLINKHGTWRDVADDCRVTVGKEAGVGEPSESWRKRILLAEHAPIRGLWFRVEVTNIKYWIAMELRTHCVGVVPADDIQFAIRSQRTDRTGIPRDDLPQSALVTMRVMLNANALINISRRRLCLKEPTEEARHAWRLIVDTVATVDHMVASVCVPDCVYRGQCHAFSGTCGYFRELIR